MKHEPLINRAAIVALVTAVLALIVAAGVPISQELQDAILGLVAVVAPIAVALWGRTKVTPVE